MRPAVRIIFAPLALRGRNATRFAKCERTHGDACGRTIRLDPRLAEVAKTLYHELLHVQHPDWAEDRVAAHEELNWNRMTWKRKARLYQMLGGARLEGEE